MYDDTKSEGTADSSGLEDIESLEDAAAGQGERPEPEDDYYIRNYVLKETQGPAQTTPAAATPAAATPAPSPQVPERKPESDRLYGAPATEARATAEGVAAKSSAATAASTRSEALTGALAELLDASPDVEAAALVSLDGLAMASVLPDTMQEDRVAAMSAAILGLGERAAAELGRGPLNQVFVEGESGYVFLMAAGGKAVLTALATRDVKIGLIFYDMRHVAAKIASIL